MCLRSRLATSLALTAILASGAVAQTDRPTDEWVSNPVDDRTFETYLEFFAYDSSVPLAVNVTASDVVDGLREERLTFQSTPGMTVTARTFRPASSTSRGGVVFIHGGTGTGKDARNVVNWTRLLARAGWTVLSIDMQYFGERNTGLFETFGAQEKADRLYNVPSLYLEWMIQTAKDAGRAFDVLAEHFQIDPNEIALVGYSRGAQMSMVAGAVESRFAAVALLHGGHFDALEHGHRPAACGANYIGRINPRPVLMINGEADTDYLPDVAVRPLQKLLGPESTVRWTDASHGILTEEDLSVLIDWLRIEVSP
jgi:dienelactone hydrolase